MNIQVHNGMQQYISTVKYLIIRTPYYFVHPSFPVSEDSVTPRSLYPRTQ